MLNLIEKSPLLFTFRKLSYNYWAIFCIFLHLSFETMLTQQFGVILLKSLGTFDQKPLSDKRTKDEMMFKLHRYYIYTAH